MKYSKICHEILMDFFGKRNRDIALNGISESNALSRLRIELNSIANSLQILPYFFYNFVIFIQWQLIFYIIKFNTGHGVRYQ